MKKEKLPFVRGSFARAIAGGLLMGIALSWGAPAFASDRRNIWERVDQFVAIEKQDGVSPPKNDHPAKVAAETLRATLGNLQVLMEDSRKPVPLLTEGELETLGDAAQQGLDVAGADEDVTFAIIGNHPAAFGLKQIMVTTGRLFVRDGRLNLILGTVHEPVNDRDDRRLKPFVPGSRAMSHRPDWRMSTANGEALQVEVGRPDWLVLTLAAAAPPARPAQDGGAREATRPLSAPSQAAAPPPPAGKSAEERLIILKELLGKGLITDEEYKTKRLQILNEL